MKLQNIKLITCALCLFIIMSCTNTANKNQSQEPTDRNKIEQATQNDSIKKILPKIIDFNATWCGPCKMMAPIIDKIEQKYAGKITVEKVDVDNNSELAKQYGIESIPTIIYIDASGKETNRTIGFLPEDELTKNIEKLIH
ncbi:MAG: thioredoxin [Muribaculaceae bacterium]|nr:thioredoxin [Muribaculaceae bacterium]